MQHTLDQVTSANWSRHKQEGFYWLRNARTITDADIAALEAQYGSDNVRFGSPKNLSSPLNVPADEFAGGGRGIYVRGGREPTGSSVP